MSFKELGKQGFLYLFERNYVELGAVLTISMAKEKTNSQLFFHR